VLGTIAHIAGYPDGLRHLRMNEVPVTSLAATIPESSSLKITDQLSPLPRHGPSLHPIAEDVTRNVKNEAPLTQ
jgi:hypothetical protein